MNGWHPMSKLSSVSQQNIVVCLHTNAYFSGDTRYLCHSMEWHSLELKLIFSLLMIRIIIKEYHQIIHYMETSLQNTVF